MFNLTVNTNSVSTLFTIVDSATGKRIVNQYVLNSKLVFTASGQDVTIAKKHVGRPLMFVRTAKAHEAKASVSWANLRDTGFALLFHIPQPTVVIIDEPVVIETIERRTDKLGREYFVLLRDGKYVKHVAKSLALITV